MSLSTELRGTIYHEAGHVVALCENGYVPQYVEVSSESTGSADCSDADLAAMDDNAVFTIALAGIHTESKARPETNVEEFARIISGGSSDRHVVDSEYRRRRGVATALSHHVMHNRAQKFVERNADKIEKVAAALEAKCSAGLPARLTRDEIRKALAS